MTEAATLLAFSAAIYAAHTGEGPTSLVLCVLGTANALLVAWRWR